MTSVSSNISEFNAYVEDIMSSIAARGVLYTGLIMDLYDGYQAASDAKFSEYIEGRYNSYLDGQEKLTPESFMATAESFYLNCKRTGDWNAPMPEQVKMMAMAAELSVLKAVKKPPLKKKDPKDGRCKGNGRRNGGKEKYPVESWMLVPLSDGHENDVKKFNGKDWRWCPKHIKWTLHGGPGNECRLTDAQAAKIAESREKEREERLALNSIREDGQHELEGE